MHKSNFLRELSARGYLNQCTDLEGLDKVLSSEKISAYVGFDCTAKSLHVGSLMQIMIMRLLQKHGHKPIILLGSATTLIGDPSDKDEARKMLTTKEINDNKESIAQIFKKFLDFSPSCPNNAIIVDNLEWLEKISYLDFLRNYGPLFSINRMLSFDSVRLRLDRQYPLSFLEFNYMLLQAYDFVELFKRHSCKLQFGGSEQWGNIVSGIELGRRTANAELFGVTSSLITTSNGAKMGKTAKGAVWLNSDMLSPYDYWQFWRNTNDSDVIRFLHLYTDLPLEEIGKLSYLKGQELNQAKILLANEATKLCHSENDAINAMNTASIAFSDSGNTDGLPVCEIDKERLLNGIPLYKLLVITSICESGNSAKKLIQGKGVKINDQLANDELSLITVNDFNNQGKLKISSGKKKHLLIELK